MRLIREYTDNTTHRKLVALVGAALALGLTSSCGSEIGTAPADLGAVVNQAPQPQFRGSPDSIDRPSTSTSTRCVSSADAAERAGRAAC